MPSFDIVSEVDLHEVTNAVDQTNREVGNRFDFKGTDTRVEQQDAILTIHSDSEFQIRQVLDILHKKIAKRGIDTASLSEGTVEISGKKAHLAITVLQGIDQGDKIRVAGKKRDDLQNTINQLRDSSPGLPLQYINFRD